MKIDKIILVILCILVFYLILTKKENMSNTDVKKMIKDIYQVDIESIRNLSKLANDLTNNGKLRVPGGLEIDGDIKCKKSIHWYGGKGRLVANGSDGANIELYNMRSKKGVHIFANFGNKGARMMINSNNGVTGTDIFNENLSCKKSIHWYGGKGRLVANGSDGGNIELYNMQSKKGIHLFANYGNRGARIMVNNKNGNIKTDIFNQKVTISGELKISNGNNRGGTHFNYQNKGENYIRGTLRLDGYKGSFDNNRQFGQGMHLTIVRVGDNTRTPIRGPRNQLYHKDHWVCIVAGKNLDWNNRDPGRIESFCYVGNNNHWHLKSEIEYARDKGAYYILCIPRGLFSHVPANNGRQPYINWY